MSRKWETIKEYREIKYEFYNGIAIQLVFAIAGNVQSGDRSSGNT